MPFVGFAVNKIHPSRPIDGGVAQVEAALAAAVSTAAPSTARTGELVGMPPERASRRPDLRLEKPGTGPGISAPGKTGDGPGYLKTRDGPRYFGGAPRSPGSIAPRAEKPGTGPGI
jgi:hypothetical protein